MPPTVHNWFTPLGKGAHPRDNTNSVFRRNTPSHRDRRFHRVIVWPVSRTR